MRLKLIFLVPVGEQLNSELIVIYLRVIQVGDSLSGSALCKHLPRKEITYRYLN